ncbi:MAG: peptidylprolyl isomerase [Chlamydiae bacterium]|nr:peptidylprolyl isomerase [Chlamydiota bacterium]
MSKIATVHYTGKKKDGQTFDSSVDREPFDFQIGQKQVIDGFEKAVLSLLVGEKKTFEIPFNEGYGPKNPDLIGRLKRELFPKDLELEIGTMLEIRGQPVTIIALDDESVTLDANHFLAGEDLIFEIELLDIK